MLIPNDWVMVHDAARLGINESMINKFISEIDGHKVGGIMAIPVSDTVKKVNDKSWRLLSTLKIENEIMVSSNSTNVSI